MIKQENFGKIINFGINVVLGIGLTLTGLIKNHGVTLESFLIGFVVSMGVGYLICDIVPACGARFQKSISNKVVATLVSTAITGFVYILLISFFNLFVSTGFIVFQVWPHTFPILYLVGYMILLVFMPIIQKIAVFLTK